MLADIFHQSPDHQKAHQEGDNAAHNENGNFHPCGLYPGQNKFQSLDGRSPQHGGNGHKEGELRTRRPGHPYQNGAQNGAAAAGGAGNQAQALKQADGQGGFVVDVIHRFDPAQMLAGGAPLHPKEGHTVDDQGNGYHNAVVQMLVHPVIKQNTHHTGGDDGCHHLEPQAPGLMLFLLGLGRGEGVELVEEQDDDRQNSPQLDHHIKHGTEGIGHIQVDKLIEQD